MQLNGAVPVLAPAMVGAPAEPQSAVTVVGGFGRESFLLHARDRVDNFESRARRIRALDDAILQWMIWVGHQLAPVRRFYPAAENIGIERWIADHRKNVAVVGIERDH